MTSLFGLTDDQAPSSTQDLLALIEPDDRAPVAAVLTGIDPCADDCELEFRVRRPDGGMRWHALRARVQRDSNGGRVRVLGVGADITEHKLLEAELSQTHKMEAVGQLAAGVAHDFNNMLTTIIGYSEMVLEQIGSDKPISGDLGEIRKAADRAVVLTRQLLAFSRKQTLRIAAVDINDVIRQTSAMLQRLIGEDIVVRLQLMDGAPPVRADRMQLEQILMNLATNARDAMPRGGELIIETTDADAGEASNTVHVPVTAGSYLRLLVRDTGVGMDAATQEHIFEPFFTTKGVGRGTGLGLATVYGVVQQLGGYIAVSSEIGVGTTFTLYFQQSTAEPAEEISPPTRLAAAPLAQRHEVVLVVEDEAGVRELAARVLTRHGYTVLEADGPTQALELIAHYANKIALVLSDVVMPIMDGPALLARCRETRPDLRVLYMSGYKGNMLERRGELQGRTQVLEKPFSASTLLETVREALAEQVA
jgi:PAS domain S-box-containing protein